MSAIRHWNVDSVDEPGGGHWTWYCPEWWKSSHFAPAQLVPDGAIVGLELALLRPDLVASLVFGEAPFEVGEWRTGVLGSEPPAFMADAYAELSPDDARHWPVVVEKSNRMHALEPAISEADLRRLSIPVLIVLADDGEVHFDHAVRMYEA